MDYFVIYAHPNPKSFNSAVRQEIESILKEKNRTYQVRDLYQTKFDPVLSADDFTAFKQGSLPADIKQEQELISQAEKLIVINPIWWFSMPAILKGYIDRVFSYGFAYSVKDGKPYGLLKDKKAMIFNTTGGTQQAYKEFGFKDAILKAVDVGIFQFCAIEVLLHNFMHAVPSISQAERENMLKQLHEIKF